MQYQNYKSKPFQSLMDIAIQFYGTPESVVKLCADNGLNIGDRIQVGAELLVDTTYCENENIRFLKGIIATDFFEKPKPNCKYIEVYKDHKIFITKASAIAQPIDLTKLEVEGTAELSYNEQSGLINVDKSGTLTGLKVYRNDTLLEFFPFIEGKWSNKDFLVNNYFHKVYGCLNGYALLLKDVEEFEYYRDEKSENAEYYFNYLQEFTNNYVVSGFYSPPPFVITNSPQRSFVLKIRTKGEKFFHFAALNRWGFRITYWSIDIANTDGFNFHINFTKIKIKLPTYNYLEHNNYEFYVSKNDNNVDVVIVINGVDFYVTETFISKGEVSKNDCYILSGSLGILKAWNKAHSIIDLKNNISEGLFLHLTGKLDINRYFVNEVGENIRTTPLFYEISEAIKFPLNHSKKSANNEFLEDVLGRRVNNE